MTLALLLINDDGVLFEWRLFPYCVVFPVVTIALSWGLVLVRRSLVSMALALATVSAVMIHGQYKADLRTREAESQLLRGTVDSLELNKPKKGEEQNFDHEVRSLRIQLEYLDVHTIKGVPPSLHSSAELFGFR